MRSASRSASSRYWVVSSTVALGGEIADHLPELLPAARFETGRRLVEEEGLRLRAADQTGRRVEPAPHPAGVRADGAAGGFGEAEAFEEFGGPQARVRPGAAGQPAHHAQVLLAGLRLVDGGVLPGEADRAAHPAPVGHDIVPGDAGRAAVGGGERVVSPWASIMAAGGTGVPGGMGAPLSAY